MSTCLLYVLLRVRVYLYTGFCCLVRDLKRDIAKKLEKLERRTQRAIVELISEWRGRMLGVWLVGLGR